jgi:hypothetical protein
MADVVGVLADEVGTVPSQQKPAKKSTQPLSPFLTVACAVIPRQHRRWPLPLRQRFAALN